MSSFEEHEEDGFSPDACLKAKRFADSLKMLSACAENCALTLQDAGFKREVSESGVSSTLVREMLARVAEHKS